MVDADVPEATWQVPPSRVPTPIPIEIVAGGPADVRLTVIGKPDEVTVKVWKSLEPTWTVPEKLSVTSGVEGALGSVDDVLSALVEQPPAIRAKATSRLARVCFTSTSLKMLYMSERWRGLDKSNAFTAAISS